MTASDSADPAEQAILRLLRDGARSISPVDAARALAGEQEPAWRRGLAPVRQAVMRLARSGQIEILRKGKPVAPEEARGVIRIRLARLDSSPGSST